MQLQLMRSEWPEKIAGANRKWTKNANIFRAFFGQKINQEVRAGGDWNPTNWMIQFFREQRDEIPK